MSYKNYVGQHIGELDVLEDLGVNDKNRHIWRCKCSCGNECIKTSYSLSHSKHPSCNKCFWNKKYIGKTFGRLVVLDEYIKVSDTGRRTHMCICKCNCGNDELKHIQLGSLKNGSVVSCGCYIRELKQKHKYVDRYTYASWRSMLNRCYNKNSNRYHEYGERGIVTCEEWLDFDNFYEDMGKRPKGLTLNRKDNDKNYCPENCEWSTPKEQANNTRRNVIFEYNGENFTLAEICDRTGANYKSLWQYLFRRNLELDEAIEKAKCVIRRNSNKE